MRVRCAALAFFLLAAPLIFAGSDNGHPATAQTKGILLSGKVSDDGKQLLADDDNSWKVANLDALKGLAGRYVLVKCRMDVTNRAIRVLSVEEPSETRHAAHLGDAAFRR